MVSFSALQPIKIKAVKLKTHSTLYLPRFVSWISVLIYLMNSLLLSIFSQLFDFIQKIQLGQS